ncbi:MAG: AMP-binding protein, partial [Spirochaetales bacterium]
MKRTITSCLIKAAQEFPERVYVARKTDAGWKSYGFGEVYLRACGMAYWFRNTGIVKGDRIAILAEGSPQWVITEFGALFAGAIAVPLSIKLLPDEISFRLNHSEAKYIAVSNLSLEKVLEALKTVQHPICLLYLDEDETYFFRQLETRGIDRRRGQSFFQVVEENFSHASIGPKYEDEISEEDIVTISYTSGTTGNPKGIMLCHRNYYTNTQDSVEIFKVPMLQYQTLLILPCDHSFGHTVGIFCAVLRGISLYFVDARGGGMGMARNIPINLIETNPVFLLTVPALSGNFMRKIQQGVREKGPLVKALFDLGIQAGVRYYGDGFNRPPFRIRAKYFFLHRLVDLILFKKIRKTFGNRIQFFVGGGALLDIK